MQIDMNLPPRQKHEPSTSGIRRSKVKVTGGRSYVWKPGGDIILDPLRQRHEVNDENVAFEKWGTVLHIVLTARTRVSYVRLAHALVCLIFPV